MRSRKSLTSSDPSSSALVGIMYDGSSTVPNGKSERYSWFLCIYMLLSARGRLGIADKGRNE